MPPISILSIPGIHIPHPFREIRLRRFDVKVVMGRHQTKTKKDKSKFTVHRIAKLQAFQIVLRPIKNLPILHASVKNMVKSAWVFDP